MRTKPKSPSNLANKTLLITGASRGIGKAIALRAARDGANIIIAAKTVKEHSALPGTIYSAAEEIEAAGGHALPCMVNIRFEAMVQKAIAAGVERFGGIDILVNNASAISLTDTENTPLGRYDLMHNVNTRGSFVCSQACLPHLRAAENPHILNIAPPLNLDARWFKEHVAYTIAKYGMSMCVLGMAEELFSAIEN
jgi:citronellol/citronellal dehydrogenase